MSFWQTVAPIATIGAAAIPGVGPLAAMGIGAATSAMAARERNQQMNAKAAQSRNAAADAIGASWARKDGRGYVPDIFNFNESEGGNMMAGSLGGAMQGLQSANFAKQNPGFFQGGLFGGGGQEPSGGVDFMKINPYGPQKGFAQQAQPF